ncbi:unnamed protein product [Clonostachys rhizophaga]|uniref:Uncharacterized protein n=1 Tax=Clonostachys rhizophaga TaxID=160324 RepID=A0A9N9VPE5_9HYPO|nr:unnamed protein product [Clonostachys rhizophaga]
MASLFCCDGVLPYRPQHLDHEEKFRTFMQWAKFPRDSFVQGDNGYFSRTSPSFAVQLVKQVNYGPLEAKRYFIPEQGGTGNFVEVSENYLIEGNFEKLNSYKNWKCEQHKKFFETNIYQKNPNNKHHWRLNIARPSNEIDL